MAHKAIKHMGYMYDVILEQGRRLGEGGDRFLECTAYVRCGVRRFFIINRSRVH